METDVKTVAQRYNDEVFGQRNLTALDELVAPDFVGYSASFGEYTREDMRRDIARDRDEAPAVRLGHRLPYGARDLDATSQSA